VILHCTSTYPAKEEDSTSASSRPWRRSLPARSVIRGTKSGCRPPSPPRSWVRAWWSGISPSTAPCGQRPGGLGGAQGMARLVRDIRATEAAMGDGVKRVYGSEVPILEKLRRAPLKPCPELSRQMKHKSSQGVGAGHRWRADRWHGGERAGRRPPPAPAGSGCHRPGQGGRDPSRVSDRRKVKAKCPGSSPVRRRAGSCTRQGKERGLRELAGELGIDVTVHVTW